MKKIDMYILHESYGQTPTDVFMSIEFEISKLLEISAKQKYATTVAGFKIIDNIDQIELPKKFMTRKPAVKAMIALSDGHIKWDYIGDEARMALEEELRTTRKTHTALDAVFSAPGGSLAPASEELDEDLEEIGETAPPEEFKEDTEEVAADVDDVEDDDDEDEDDEKEDDDKDADADDDDDKEDDDEDEVLKDDEKL
jgi:hypothetical protein